MYSNILEDHTPFTQLNPCHSFLYKSHLSSSLIPFLPLHTTSTEEETWKLNGSGYVLYNRDLIHITGIFFFIFTSELVMRPAQLAIQLIKMVFTWIKINKPQHGPDLHPVLRHTNHNALPLHSLYTLMTWCLQSLGLIHVVYSLNNHRKIFNIINPLPLLTNTVSVTWSAAISKLLYHVSAMLGTCSNLNVATRVGRVPFKEALKGLNIS